MPNQAVAKLADRAHGRVLYVGDLGKPEQLALVALCAIKLPGPGTLCGASVPCLFGGRR